jgi:branched-chain amino acid transport system substrate-binding protein
MVYTAAISSSAPDYTAQCLAAKQAGADGIFDAEASSVITTVAGDCSKQGYNPVELANDGSISTSFPTSPGMSGMAGVTLDIPFFVKSTPAAKAMYAAFNKYQPSILTSPNFGDPTSTAYVSGLLFGAAAKAGGVGAHGTPTAKQVIAGLYKLKGATLGGMAPALTYHRNKPNSIKCYFKLSIQGGKFTLPDGTKTSCT